MTDPSRLPAGSPIPGSKYFREYCPRCHEPMRVTADRVKSPPLCGDCDPKHIGVGNPSKPIQDDDAYGQSWRNA